MYAQAMYTLGPLPASWEEPEYRFSKEQRKDRMWQKANPNL